MFSDKLKQRADGISDWLDENHPEITKEQAHLRKGAPERAYWHYGYCIAMRDVMRELDRLNNPVNADDARNGDSLDSSH